MAHVILAQWVDFFGAPDIIVAVKDPMFVGAKVSQFCRDRNVSLQTEIPGNRQSLRLLKDDIGILKILRNIL